MLSSIPIAYALGVLTIGQLYLVGFVNGVFTVFFDVADQSYLPTVLERDELVDGNSKLQISQSAAHDPRPAVRRRRHRPLHGPDRDRGRRAELRRLGAADLHDPASGGVAGRDRGRGCGGGDSGRGTARWRRDRRDGSGNRGGARGRQARHADRDHERAPLHLRQQVPAEHRSDDRDREPVQQHRLRDVRGLRLPRAGPVAAVRRADRRDRRRRRADRGPDREPGRGALRRWPGDRLAECDRRDRRPARAARRRSAGRCRIWRSRSSSAASPTSSTTSTRSACARRSRLSDSSAG